MQEPMQQPKPKKTIHIGYIIAIIIPILAVIIAVIFWPDNEPGPGTPTPTPITTASPTSTVVPTPTTAPVTAVNVSVVVPTTIVGKDFHVLINISEVSNLAGAQYDIKYDPKIIKVIEVTAGQINGTVIPLQQWSLKPVSTQGLVRIVNLIDVKATPAGISGEGCLADIHFRAIGASGTSAISFVEGQGDPVGYLNIGDISANYIPAGWINGTVTIH